MTSDPNNTENEPDTTGHEWDGIKEYDNPLPRWWLWIFYATIVWSVGYMVFWPALPGLPGMQGHTRGVLNHSDRVNVARDLQKLDDARSGKFTDLVDASLQEIEADPDLFTFALAAGESAFGDNCATCHGSGAQGFVGYPNLNDDAWLWGGSFEAIKQTITYGIRSSHPETRFSQMPAYGDGIFDAAAINDLAEYVLDLSGQEADQAAVQRASENWEYQCAACHGPNGAGDPTFGAPNLKDAVWLYGGDRETLQYTIARGPAGMMPAWNERLDEATIAALAVYVHSLGGGERSGQARARAAGSSAR